MSMVNRTRAAWPRLENLESRRVMAVTYGANVVLNPGAETFTGTANGNNIVQFTSWTANADPTAGLWSSGNASSSAIPQPPGTGSFYFTGGPDQAEADLFQTIDITSIATDIDAGHAKFTLSALLGGFGSQNDNATLFVNFQDASHAFTGQSFVGPVLAADRSSNNGLLARTTAATTVPTGSRFAQVQIHFERSSGTYDDGYADNVSLIFNNTTAPPAPGAKTLVIDSHAATFAFDQSLSSASIAASDLEMTNLATNVTTHPATATSLSADLKTVTFVLPTNVADGNYRLRIPAGAISGGNGAATTVNDDLTTYFLAGDANRDRSVNFADLVILAQNYGKSSQTFSHGDFNYDGTVGFADLALLAQRYNTSILQAEAVATPGPKHRVNWRLIDA